MANTKIAPAKVFSLVKLLPKELQNEFAKEAYQEVQDTSVDFVPDPELRYDHSLGLSWLTKHNIPNTVEELEAQRQYVFQTMLSGASTYNVGQFIVVFPNVVYGSRDIENNTLVIEVMDELEFPELPDLTVPFNDDIRAATFESADIVALRYALQSYVVQGKIRIHEAGVRMYSNAESYKFQERFEDTVTEKPVSFIEAARRR